MTKHGKSSSASVLIEQASATVAVAVYGEDSPADDEWQVYLDVMKGLKPGYRMVIFSNGGGPTTMQRGDLEKVTEGQETSRVAVVTVSRVARGIVTAIRWFNRDIKAFQPADREAAFRFLEFTKEEEDAVLRLAKTMATKLGVAEPLLLTA